MTGANGDEIVYPLCCDNVYRCTEGECPTCGCTDEVAYNTTIGATYENGSCLYNPSVSISADNLNSGNITLDKPNSTTLTGSVSFQSQY